MSIRFRCEKCGQKLRVGDDRSGLQARCPKCKAPVTVPMQSQLPEESAAVKVSLASAPVVVAGGQPTVPKVDEAQKFAPSIRVEEPDFGMLTEIVIRDDSDDWLQGSPQRPSPAETMIDYDKVAIPRRVLYLQGVLLGVVALVSFVLGMLLSGDKSRDQTANGGTVPCVLQGQIVFGTDDPRPDDGSVVIAVPAERRPAADGRVAIDGLRPSDPVPADGHVSLRTIRSLGGDLVRANDEGNYRLHLPEPGRYHVLIISRRAQRSGGDRLEVNDVAQIGRYFSDVVQLVDDRKYQWRSLTVRGESTLDATF